MFSRKGSIELKKPEQFELMRAAGLVVADTLRLLREAVAPGLTTADLDAIARESIAAAGAAPSFLGYHGFPAVICTSVNDEIVHGIPGPRVINDGDVVSIDCGAIVDGWHGDAAFTAPVGHIGPELRRLIEVAEASLAAGIAQLVDGHRLGDVGHAVQRTVELAGFTVVREYTGHAIGQAMHEQPSVPNFGEPGSGSRIRTGNVFAVEPMVNLGTADTAVLDDDWSVVTADGSWSAHVEHTVAVTRDGPEILTI